MSHKKTPRQWLDIAVNLVLMATCAFVVAPSAGIRRMSARPSVPFTHQPKEKAMMKNRLNLILRSVLVATMLAGFLMLPADTAQADPWDQCHWACSNICIQRCQYSPNAACHSTCLDSCVELFCAQPLPV